MIDTAQYTINGTVATMGRVPPGPCSVTITNSGAVALFVGAGTGVTTSTGAPVPGPGVVTLPGFPGSSGVNLWGITSGGTVTAGVFISNGS